VADGAVSFFLDHFVAVRVSRLVYGIPSSTLYNPKDVEHVRRASQTYLSLSGDVRMRGHFSIILDKVIQRGPPFSSPCHSFIVSEYPTLRKSRVSEVVCGKGR
jgi:hypothetical protein